MFSGFASFLPWSGAKQSTTSLVDVDLESGDGDRARIDDDRLSSVSSFRIVDSSASSIAGVNRDRDLLSFSDHRLGDGLGAGPSLEESTTDVVPRFISTMGRSTSTPPETLRINPPPDSLFQQLQDQDQFYSATSSSSSGSSNHSYARFFHRTRTPKRTRSTLSLGPGGTHNGLGALSPIYEPSNADSRDSAAMPEEGEAGESSGPAKKTPAPSIHSTTSTIQERIMNLQATHPAFLKRSLKRSLSATSSNSLHSEASGAPQIPPLHFRPAFTGIPTGILASPTTSSPGPPSAANITPQPPRVVVPTRPPLSTTISPQRSHPSYSQPNTPQSLTTPRSHRFGVLDYSQKCSAIYEDSASEKSFVTAETGETEPGPGVITKHDIPSTADLIIYPEGQEQTGERSGHVEERGQTVQEQPSTSNLVSMAERPRTERETTQHHGKVFSDSETTFNVTSDSQHGHNPVPTTTQRPNRVGNASVMSIASTTVKNESLMADDRVVEETATIVEDEGFITERWMKTLFYSSSGGKDIFSTAKEGDQKQYPVSSTCVLFWAGFIAPWCWLVGGWMLPKDTPVLENGMDHEKLKEQVNAGAERDPQGEDGAGFRKWILPNPSSSFRATARAPSISSATTLCPKEVEEAGLAMVDPWVRRCRIASIVGGTMLGLGLIAMAIVLGVVMH